MINKAPTVNSYRGVETLSDSSEKVSRHLTTNQSAAMNAALLIGVQYSPASKSKYRQECLSHLKASLAPAQDVSA